jgi:hypothetical protein
MSCRRATKPSTDDRALVQRNMLARNADRLKTGIEEVRRAEPSRAEPCRAVPSRAVPCRAEPSRAEPTRPDPSRAEPTRAEPSRAEPSRAEPTRAVPVRGRPESAGAAISMPSCWAIRVCCRSRRTFEIAASARSATSWRTPVARARAIVPGRARRRGTPRRSTDRVPRARSPGWPPPSARSRRPRHGRPARHRQPSRAGAPSASGLRMLVQLNMIGDEGGRRHRARLVRAVRTPPVVVIGSSPLHSSTAGVPVKTRTIGTRHVRGFTDPRFWPSVEHRRRSYAPADEAGLHDSRVPVDSPRTERPARIEYRSADPECQTRIPIIVLNVRAGW